MRTLKKTISMLALFLLLIGCAERNFTGPENEQNTNSTTQQAQVDWRAVAGIPGNGNDVVTLGTNLSGYIFAGTKNGVYYSKNEGNTWVFAGLRDTTVRALTFDSRGNTFAGSPFGLYSRANYSGAFKKVAFQNSRINVLKKEAQEVFWAGTSDGIYFSNDGFSWDSHGLENKVVLSLWIAPEGNLYAGVKDEGLYLSINKSLEWRKIFLSNDNLNINAIIRTPAGRMVIGTATHGIYASDVNGAQWLRLNGGLGTENFSVNSLIVWQGNTLAGLDGGGIAVLKQNATRWEPFERGLSNNRVTAFAVSYYGKLYAATAGGGVFRH